MRVEQLVLKSIEHKNKEAYNLGDKFFQYRHTVDEYCQFCGRKPDYLKDTREKISKKLYII